MALPLPNNAQFTTLQVTSQQDLFAIAPIFPDPTNLCELNCVNELLPLIPPCNNILAALKVNGAAVFCKAINIGNTDQKVIGSIRFNNGRFQGFNGVEWVNLDCCTEDELNIIVSKALCNGEDHVTITPSSSLSPNASLSIGPLGLGFLSAQEPTPGSSIGGDCRGENAVDWQMVRIMSTQVASGNNSVICGGVNNSATSDESGILGGTGNMVSGDISFVLGGDNNSVTSSGSIICGGVNNSISGNESGILGGTGNVVSGDMSSILGGVNNNNTGDNSVICGGVNNSVSGDESGILGGTGNVVSGDRSSISGGISNDVSGDNSVISGGATNSVTSNNSVIVGGLSNRTVSNFSMIGSGDSNIINSEAEYGIIGGGTNNSISTAAADTHARRSAILGGENNEIANRDTTTADWSAIVGGLDNVICNRANSEADYSFIGGGNSNRIVDGNVNVAAEYSSIVGGFGNLIGVGPNSFSRYSFIGGGLENTIGDSPNDTMASVICGGSNNTITDGQSSFIGSGFNNSIDTVTSAIMGGTGNVLESTSGVIGGGDSNEIIPNAVGPSDVDFGFIGGGVNNSISPIASSDAIDSAIAGGRRNIVRSDQCIIGGGSDNLIGANSSQCFIGGGLRNLIASDVNTTSGADSVIGGGVDNTIVGLVSGMASAATQSFIGGGQNNSIGLTGESFSHMIIGGGEGNIIRASHCFIGGGQNNDCSFDCDHSVISGGEDNTLRDKSHSTIVGGLGLEITAVNTATSAITVCGQYNEEGAVAKGGFSAGAAGGSLTNRVFTVGEGSGFGSKLNLFSVEGGTGSVYALGSYHSGGADYAELFESNESKKIPVGTTVKFDTNGKIITCKNKDDIPFGVISGTASVIGNDGDTEWQGKYEKTEYGEYAYEEKEIEIEEKMYSTRTYKKNIKSLVKKEDGKYYEIEESKIETEKIPIIEEIEIYNDEGKIIRREMMQKTMKKKIKKFEKKISNKFDPNINYIPRIKRPEWNIVGILGQIHIRNDCPVNPNWIKIKNINENVGLWLVK